MAIQRYFGFLNATKSYLKFLATQGVSWPAYGVRLQWDSFIRILSPRPTNASMIQPRNLSAYYANDPTALILDGSNNVILWEDWSGNSATNTLCLPGVAGNYASVPSSAALRVIGDIDVRAFVSLNNYTSSGVIQELVDKYDANDNNRSYVLRLSIGGSIQLIWSPDGISSIATQTVGAIPATNLSSIWIRATLDVDNGAGGNTATFYTSNDGMTWTMIGSPIVNTGVTSIFSGTKPLSLGAAPVTGRYIAGRIYRATIYNGIQENGGILAFDADFSKVAKLAPSFTESSSNAATVTVNSTGDTGARISGERDLYQGTASKRPAYTQANGRQRLFLTFDGTDDYLKAPSFALAQPETVYWVGSQITWTLNENIYDGHATANRMVLGQRGASPGLSISSGVTVGNITSLSLGIIGIVISIFNSTLSSNQVNRTTASTGDALTNNALGFTLGATFDGTLPSNIRTQEIAIYAEASSSQVQASIVGYLSNKYAIGL